MKCTSTLLGLHGVRPSERLHLPLLYLTVPGFSLVLLYPLLRSFINLSLLLSLLFRAFSLSSTVCSVTVVYIQSSFSFSLKFIPTVFCVCLFCSKPQHCSLCQSIFTPCLYLKSLHSVFTLLVPHHRYNKIFHT